MKGIETRVDAFDLDFRRIKDDHEDFDAITEIPDMDLTGFQRLLDARAASPFGRIFSEFRALVIDELVAAYPHLSAQERQALLDLLAGRPFVLIALWSLLDEYRWRLQKSPPQDQPAALQTLLLIAILAEQYLDEAQTAHILTSAWGDAEDGGLDPAAFFKAAAELAGSRQLTHGQSARDVLREFQPYVYGGSPRV